jgi:uncharacterized protein YbjT (DUF2867 family)
LTVENAMAEKKIIAVIGATGAQGGGLVRAILADKSGSFAARAVTRNPNSEKARALRETGVEVVAGDADKPETLGKAFAGAYGAFCLTNFWEHFSPEREIAQARNMAQAAKAAGVQHVIWSTLEDTRKWIPLEDDRMPTLMGKYKVPHFDGKGEADQIFRDLGVPTTWLLTSFYWDNLIYFGAGPQRGPDGVLAITFPMDDKPLASIAVEDIGKCALGIFKRGRELINKTGPYPGAGPGSALQQCAARGLSQLRLPQRRRSGQHVPVQARLQRILLWRAEPGVLPLAEPGATDIRAVAGGAQGSDPVAGGSGGAVSR